MNKEIKIINDNLSLLKDIQEFGINSNNSNIEIKFFNGEKNINKFDFLILKGVSYCFYEKQEEFINKQSLTPYGPTEGKISLLKKQNLVDKVKKINKFGSKLGENDNVISDNSCYYQSIFKTKKIFLELVGGITGYMLFKGIEYHYYVNGKKNIVEINL